MKPSEIIKMNHDSYNKIAQLFSDTRSYVWTDMKYLLEYVNDGDKVLDVGCGNGRLVEAFGDKKIEYLGIDFSEGLIAESRKKHPDYSFEVMDVLQLGKLSRLYDVVFMNSVLNHFPEDLHDKVLLNVKKVLAKGGDLLMINWNMWNAWSGKSVWRSAKQGGWKNVLTKWQSGETKADLFYYAFTKRELKKLLRRNGFEVEKNIYSKDGQKSNIFAGKNIVIIAKNLSEKFIRQKSSIHGWGIFTLNQIKQGEVFYHIPMADIHYDNYKRYAYVGNGQYVSDENVLNWVNHSCKPNILLDINCLDPVLIALRDIKEGEEITCNYNVTEEAGVFRSCRCGSPECKSSFGKMKGIKKIANLIDFHSKK